MLFLQKYVPRHPGLALVPLLLAFVLPSAHAEPVDGPVMDGAFSSLQEYKIPGVTRVRDVFDTGDLFYYTRADRTGTYLVVAHAFSGYFPLENETYHTLDTIDCNGLTTHFPGGESVNAIVFMEGECDYDVQWLQLLEIPETCPFAIGGDMIDNGGFVVNIRYPGVPDRPEFWAQWLPGDPMPGDPDFDPADYFGFFGMAGFNNSGYEKSYFRWEEGIPVDFEIYEFKQTVGSWNTRETIAHFQEMGSECWDYLYGNYPMNGGKLDTPDLKLNNGRELFGQMPDSDQILQYLSWPDFGYDCIPGDPPGNPVENPD